jgi:hypothetical protein
LVATSRRHGFGSVFIYGHDEAEGPALAAQRRLWRAVHEAGGKVFVAGLTGAHPIVGDLLDVFVHYGESSFGEAKLWHTSGQQIFNYANPQSGPENPQLFRLNYGIMLWANDYDGAMPYAYQHCFGSCWNDIDHPVYRDHNLTYPTADGAIPTLAWEGYREAVDDLRYVTTLESWLEQASDNNSPAVKEGRKYLNELRAKLRREQSTAGKYKRDMQIDLDAVRREIVSRILALVPR